MVTLLSYGMLTFVLVSFLMKCLIRVVNPKGNQSYIIYHNIFDMFCKALTLLFCWFLIYFHVRNQRLKEVKRLIDGHTV